MKKFEIIYALDGMITVDAKNEDDAKRKVIDMNINKLVKGLYRHSDKTAAVGGFKIFELTAKPFPLTYERVYQQI